ncbi:DNA-directed DNA polymerase [Sulfolobus acidocaldarius]|uniref:DNA-directed DNA polymerase n=4 Tax=Sulfolobus acidocaldarius TaxID=2285 RepID=Q4JCH8_SULAC|nr:DNA polymerase II [Sulfolobus acidocaldarius]AAY79501.1 DNA polymerase B3 [Sulfolobus acidocaldarius DSM 639]AGE70050.1 DNA polymerase II [Sulfolobus acidocaldarius N8]AGE72325.1 DNA polymerase II [Sulfolobus acidocaldarius Ron12/I]ALU29524.1 DNA polymerase [Sulfolobus acidocaldarius]ALU32254.1 DNA polymerase [Sulfolobus acidocaldarius]
MLEDFFVLDFSYDVVDNIPVIFIWSIDRRGNRVTLVEKNFRPYFYAVVDDREDVSRVISEIKKLSKPSSPITNIEIETDRRYFGNPLKSLKIETVVPAYVRIYRDEVSKIKGVKNVLEADIRFYMRYSIDKGIKPFYWIKADVEEIQPKEIFKVKSEKLYLIKDILEIYEAEEPRLKTMAFSIEVYNKYGFPNTRRDPIIVIGVYTENGYKQFISSDYDDINVIREFIKFVNDFEPDIIFGYNSNSFDWRYLVERAELRGIKVAIGRKVNSEPSQGVYGHYSVTGRLNVDLAGVFCSSRSKSLIDLADNLGVMPKNKREILEWYEVPRYWDDKSKREILLKHNLSNIKSIYDIGQSNLHYLIQLVKVTGLPLDQLSMASSGHRIEWLLVRESKKYNEFIPNREERRTEASDEGIIVPPVSGLHNNVYMLDFSTIYPSIILKYNISPDTLVRGDCSDCWTSLNGNYKFRKDIKGLYQNVLLNLSAEIERREEIIKTLDPEKRRRLEEELRALRSILNSFYDYIRWTNARWYVKECAEGLFEWGRELILQILKIVKESGFQVIYADTDLMFFKGENDPKKLEEDIANRLSLNLKFNKFYTKLILLEGKKQYAALTKDNKVDMVGIEDYRNNWCDLAKEVLQNVVDQVLRSDKINEAVRYVKSVIYSLRRGEFKIEDLVTWNIIDKDIEEYKFDLPHIVAARKAMKSGHLVTRGSKIGYVIVKGSGKLSNRAEPYFMVKEKSKVDIEYYIDKQIIPSALKVLGLFGVKENTFKFGGTDVLNFFKK